MPSLTIPTTATAAEVATAALAEWGITPQLADESLIGGHRNTWLVISSDQTTNGVPDQSCPYVALYVYTDEHDEVWVHRPIVSPFDCWHVVVGNGTDREQLDFTARAPEIDRVAERIADWLTAPRS
ncbi:hypothetical protein [Streptomyces sp. NPDC058751]|uniref:hypothetical protein n=1 Tax=Streptomyces sp. NPDC058751 TaxID=3346623 RepID=UPI0036907E4D